MSRSGKAAMSGLLYDLRFAGRAMRRSPGTVAAAVLMLALGVGSATAIFSIVNSVLVQPLPWRDSERLMTLWERDESGQRMRVSLPNFRDWSAQARSFEAMTGRDSRGSGRQPHRGGVIELSKDQRTDLYAPVATGGPDGSGRSAHNWQLMGRLRTGVEVDEARAEMQTMGERIRLALGATPQSVRRSVLRSGLRMTVAGIVGGALLALAGGRLISAFLFGVRETDAGVFVGAVVALTLSALLACYLPARRASRIDPMAALRYE